MTGGKKAATAGFFRIIEKLAEARVNARAEFSCENTESGVKTKKLSFIGKPCIPEKRLELLRHR